MKNGIYIRNNLAITRYQKIKTINTENIVKDSLNTPLRTRL